MLLALGGPLALFWATTSATGAGSTVLETETMTIPSGSDTHVFNDSLASGGKGLSWPTNDTVTASVTTSSPTTTLTLRARGDQCQGAPNATVAIDGSTKLTASIAATSWTDYSAAVNIPAGTHSVAISFTNDLYKPGTCDRNLRTDKLTFVGGTGGGDTTPPAPPTGLSATAGNASVSLSWAANSETDLAGYNLYRSTTNGGPYTQVNTSLLTARTFSDSGLTNGTTYYYVVKAVDTSSNVSNASSQASATPTGGTTDTTPPAPPTGLTATPGNASASLAWSANTEPDLGGYNVYRSTTSGGSYTKLNSSLLTARSYNDMGLTNGTKYYYVVRAVDTSNNVSNPSSEASATPSGGGGGGGGVSGFEAEAMTIDPTSDTHVFTDSSASGGKAVSYPTNDTITTTVNTIAGSTISVRARGDQCNGAPNMVVAIDGQTAFSTAVPAVTWTSYSASYSLSAGSHSFAISFTNDLYKPGTCDRNLRVDSVTIGSSGGGGTPTLQLPDLVQEPPIQVSVSQSSASWRLGFNSAVENHGAGPLVVNGHRPDTSSTMVADQIINRTDGSTQTFAGIGSMIFYVPHNHWHYVGFDRYQLRKPSDNSLVAPDQKSGFCLGDRYTPNSDGTRNENPTPGPWTFNNCQPGNTAALQVTEGITPGYGDEYVPQLEGQYIDVTGVAPGQYWIVFTVNSDAALKESDYTNDSASTLISLWPNGYGVAPYVTVLKTCPGTATCSLTAGAPSIKYARKGGWPIGGLPYQLRHSPPPDDAPLLVPRSARFFAHQALQRVVGSGSSKARLRCVRHGRAAFSCATSWHLKGATYRGSVRISLPPRNADHWWLFQASLVRREGKVVTRLQRGRTRVLVRTGR